MGSYIRFDQAKKRLLRKVVKWGIKIYWINGKVFNNKW